MAMLAFRGRAVGATCPVFADRQTNWCEGRGSSISATQHVTPLLLLLLAYRPSVGAGATPAGSAAKQ